MALLLSAAVLFTALPSWASMAVRIKDLAQLRTGQEIQLTGLGLMIGLEGTGDGRQASFTLRMLANMMQRMQLTVDPRAIRVRNVAAVTATAVLSPYQRAGSSIDVQVASIGDAVSLQGGTLLRTPMTGPDGLTYVQAQGSVSIGGFNLGGGGPGAGPIGVKQFLKPYLPQKMATFQGNVGVMVRAYTYLKMIGKDGLIEISRKARENANYLKEKLSPYYDIPYSQECEHEFVISCADKKKQYGIKALDIAKRIIDYGFHPPTVYFPLIVPECLMVEPTETESKETLDEFAEAMIRIAEECKTSPELVKTAPHTAPLKRLDEVKAVKEPVLRYSF